MLQQFSRTSDPNTNQFLFTAMSGATSATTTCDYVFNIPPEYSMLTIIASGGGGGGGGGMMTSAVLPGGGGGGAAGSMTTLTISTSLIPAMLYIKVGCGGKFGAGGQSDGANGSNGTAGSPTNIYLHASASTDHCLLTAPGGGNGGGGASSTAGTAGSASAAAIANMPVANLGVWVALAGQSGSAGSLSAQPTAITPQAPTTGGAGGGGNNGTRRAGGIVSPAANSLLPAQVASPINTGTAGYPGFEFVVAREPNQCLRSWGGGGVGALGTGNTATNAGQGGYGSGGGGGCSSASTTAVAGGGGNGGSGFVLIQCW